MTQSNVVHSYYEILLKYKKEQTIDTCKNLGGFPRIRLSEKRIFIYITFLEVNRLVISRVKGGVLGWVEGRWAMVIKGQSKQKFL